MVGGVGGIRSQSSPSRKSKEESKRRVCSQMPSHKDLESYSQRMAHLLCAKVLTKQGWDLEAYA